MTSFRLSFLVYLSRSGSTFFGERLNRHPDVLIVPESTAAPRLRSYFEEHEKKGSGDCPRAEALVDMLLEERKLVNWGLTRDYLLDVFRAESPGHWADAFRLLCAAYRNHKKPAATVVVFKKSAWYWKRIDVLLTAFADAQSIWMVRDPRAIFNSARQSIYSETNRPMSESVVKSAREWCVFIDRLEMARERWGDRVHPVRYESMLQDVSGAVQSAWQALGVDVPGMDQVAAWLETASGEVSHLITPATQHLHSNVSRPAQTACAEKWRSELPQRHALWIRWVCRKGMKAWDYA